MSRRSASVRKTPFALNDVVAVRNKVALLTRKTDTMAALAARHQREADHLSETLESAIAELECARSEEQDLALRVAEALFLRDSLMAEEATLRGAEGRHRAEHHSAHGLSLVHSSAAEHVRVLLNQRAVEIRALEARLENASEQSRGVDAGVSRVEAAMDRIRRETSAREDTAAIQRSQLGTICASIADAVRHAK